MKTDEGSNIKAGGTNNPSEKNNKTAENYAQRLAREDGVKKGVWTTSVVSIIILVIAGVLVFTHFSKESKVQTALMENQKQQYTNLLNSRDSTINQWMLTFDQIEKDLNLVKDKESMITLNSSNAEFSKDKREQVRKDIENINSLLDQNRKKIASLSAQLKNSGGAMKALQAKMADLENSMKMRETEVSDLKTALAQKDIEIGDLNSRMVAQKMRLDEKNDTINNQTTEMHKGYLAYGTYKDLKEKGLVSKEGGFLGLGRTEALSSTLPDSSFTRVDITEMKAIPVNAKSIKLITDHPRSSYELIRDKDNKISSIEILDPQQFWKISKYAVVELKQ